MKKNSETFANAVTITLGMALGISFALAAAFGMLMYNMVIGTAEACSFLLRAL
jgi:hypothetical protein